LYAYVGNNPINRVDPDGQIAIVAAAAVAWAVVEVALSISDAYDVVSTWADPEASLATKAGTTILAGAGLILPGGGYSKADDGIRAVANVVEEGTQAAAKKIDDVVQGATGLKNASGNLDDAAQAARTQRHNTPNLTQHARQRMAQRGVSVERVQEGIDKGTRTVGQGPAVRFDIPASGSASGRALRVIQDVRTNNVVTIIDKGSGK
jgi:hypothetical protein